MDRRTAVRTGLAVGGAAWLAPSILTTERVHAQFSPGLVTALYLQGGTSLGGGATNPGPMSLTPGASLTAKEIKKDGATVLAQGDSSGEKHHGWSFQAPAGGIAINGSVQLFLFAGAGGGTKGVTAALYDQATNTIPIGGSPTSVGPVATGVTWTGSGISQRTVSFGTVTHTIAAGRWLVLKIVNRDSGPWPSNEDWTAQWNSAAQNSRLTITL